MNAHRPYRCRLWTTAAALAFAALAAGCSPAFLTVDDAILQPDHHAELVAHVDREAVGALWRHVDGVKVVFYVDGVSVGDSKTNDQGRASQKCSLLSPPPTRFEARATVEGSDLRAVGRLFAWDPDRTIIVVDVDKTLALTEYKELVLDRQEEESHPVKDSREVLNELSKDFGILYLTGSPRSLLDRTRQWLEENEYPAGPVITAPSLRQAMHARTFKLHALHALRENWPNMLIGIGDRPSDAAAYGASEMLTLITSPKRDTEYGVHAIMLRNWKTIGRFFEANRATLADPQRLREVIKGQTMLLQPVMPWGNE